MSPPRNAASRRQSAIRSPPPPIWNSCYNVSVTAFSADCRSSLPKQCRPTLKGTTVKRTIVAGLLAFLGGGVLLVVVVAAWLMHSALSGRAPEIIEEVGPVYCVAVSRDGQRIVCGYQDSRARVWNINSGKLLAEFGDQRPAVVCAAFSPTANRSPLLMLMNQCEFGTFALAGKHGRFAATPQPSRRSLICQTASKCCRRAATGRFGFGTSHPDQKCGVLEVMVRMSIPLWLSMRAGNSFPQEATIGKVASMTRRFASGT